MTAFILDIYLSWMSKYQPCLFGRIAAKRGLLSYCLLSEEDLAGSDSRIREKIQAARSGWSRRGFEGAASGFVILLRSPRLANAVPNDTVKQIALRICSLYLLKDVEPDTICTDNLWLEQPGNSRHTWEWTAGVNYFSAQGDGRWWQDHRIPAGMAFSVNSVGHMTKSGKLAQAFNVLEEVMGTSAGAFKVPKVDSLATSLEFAMRTIHLASEGPSGKATKLLPADLEHVPSCPIKLPAFLQDKNHCEYEGHYHTDFTVPGEYFLPDVERPPATVKHLLDFTYLFDDSLENPDFDLMGKGRLIRADSGTKIGPLTAAGYKELKRSRQSAGEREIDAIPLLCKALG